MNRTRPAGFGALGVLIAGIVAGTGCREPDAPPTTSSTDSPVDAPKCGDDAKALERTLTLEKRAREATAANRGAHESSLTRQTRQNAAVGVHRRIPHERDHSDTTLVRSLEASVGDAAVVIRDVTVGPPSAAPRAIPATSNEPFQWTADDLLVQRTVRFVVESLTWRRLEQWHVGLPKRLPRLLVLESLEEVPGGHRVTGQIYSFRAVTPPKHKTRTPALSERLAAAGLVPSTCPSESDRFARMAGLVDELAALEPAAEETLGALSAVRLEGKRFETFERLTRRWAKQSPKTLLGRQ